MERFPVRNKKIWKKTKKCRKLLILRAFLGVQPCILLCNYVQLVSTTVTRNKLESLGSAFLLAFD